MIKNCLRWLFEAAALIAVLGFGVLAQGLAGAGPPAMVPLNCQGCCSRHGGVVCDKGVTRCRDGSALSATCKNKGCNACY
jgi:hypothetical protein